MWMMTVRATRSFITSMRAYRWSEDRFQPAEELNIFSWKNREFGRGDYWTMPYGDAPKIAGMDPSWHGVQALAWSFLADRKSQNKALYSTPPQAVP
jgi:hypothetical protein